MIKKLRMSKIIISLIVIIVIIFGGILIYSINIIQTLDSKMQSLSLLKLHNEGDRAIIFEKDAIVAQKDLEHFFSFIEKNIGNKKYIKSLITQGVINKHKSYYEFAENFEIAGNVQNDCERIYCLQVRRNFSELPSILWKGLIGIEDVRFLEHPGVDYLSLIRALVKNIIAGKYVQGGSTLTQQLIKNLLLTSEKALSRKYKEMIYAFYLEQNAKKEDILQIYLNEVFWGTFQGVYLRGVYSASLAYFAKTPHHLTEYEAAILISMLKGPFVYSPLKKPEKLRSRADLVYSKLMQEKMIASDKNGLWSDKKWKSWLENVNSRSKLNYFKDYYYSQMNRSKFLNDYEKFILVNGISKTKKILGKRIEGKDIGVKILIRDLKCNDDQCLDQFTYYSKYERSLKNALFQEKHQIGSIFKPIVYNIILNKGRDLQDLVDTSPIQLKLKSGNWSPRDSSKSKMNEITLRQALQKSRNIPLIRLTQEIGFDEIEKELLKYIPDLLLPLKEYPAQLLGAVELSLDEVSNIYLKFIKEECQRLKLDELSIEDSIIYVVSDASQTTISKVANNILKNVKLFGKTGTTNQGQDNWFVAFDGKRVYVIWFGIETDRGKKAYLSGSSTSFRILQNYLPTRGQRIEELSCPDNF